MRRPKIRDGLANAIEPVEITLPADLRSSSVSATEHNQRKTWASALFLTLRNVGVTILAHAIRTIEVEMHLIDRPLFSEPSALKVGGDLCPLLQRVAFAVSSASLITGHSGSCSAGLSSSTS